MTSVMRISETFDLSTTKDKIGLIGIHTPPRALLERHFGPMMRNHRFVKLLKCDVTLVPTAGLPLDPLGVGIGANEIDPQDAINPILYKAVSNSHFETIISRIYGGTAVAPSSDGSSIVRVDGICDSNAPTGMSDHNIYYGLLAQPSGWRKAFWNTGFHMGGLKPLMYQLIANYGNESIYGSTDMRQRPVMTDPNNAVTNINSADASGGAMMRGRAVRCPALPLWGGLRTNAQIGSLVEPIPCPLPTVYVGAVIIPPASRAGRLMYYRLRITWTFALLGLVSYQEHSNMLTISQNGDASYWADYSVTKLEKEEDVVDVSGLDIGKIMESGGGA